MPSSAEHVNQAVHNIRLVCLLGRSADFHDWMATVSFYSALHVIEALLSCQNPARHGHNHEDREHLIKCNSLYDPITKHYRRLEAASSVARYLKKYPGFADYMTPREVCQELIQHRLLVIMRFAVECGKLPDAQQRLLRGSIKEIEQLRPSLPA